MFGPDERLIACNAQHHKMYGLDPDVIKPGVTLRELIAHWIAVGNAPEMSAEEFYEKRKTAVTGRSISTTQLRLKEGRVIEQTSPVRHPTAAGCSAHEDVTERVRADQALREQNILFDAALENMAHGLCMLDKDWRVVVRNRRYLEMYDLSPEETLPGTPVLEVIRSGMARGTHDGKQTAEEYLAAFKQRAAESKDGIVNRRVAGTLCYLDWAMDGGPEPQTVEAWFIEAAVRLWRNYFWPHSRAAVRQIGLTDHHAEARRVLRWIRAGRRALVSREDVRRDALSQRLNADEVQTILDELVRAGWMREVTARAEGPGRAARRWAVNPTLLSRGTAGIAGIAEIAPADA